MHHPHSKGILILYQRADDWIRTMPAMTKTLTLRELLDLVEYLFTLTTKMSSMPLSKKAKRIVHFCGSVFSQFTIVRVTRSAASC